MSIIDVFEVLSLIHVASESVIRALVSCQVVKSNAFRKFFKYILLWVTLGSQQRKQRLHIHASSSRGNSLLFEATSIFRQILLEVDWNSLWTDFFSWSRHGDVQIILNLQCQLICGNEKTRKYWTKSFHLLSFSCCHLFV